MTKTHRTSFYVKDEAQATREYRAKSKAAEKSGDHEASRIYATLANDEEKHHRLLGMLEDRKKK